MFECKKREVGLIERRLRKQAPYIVRKEPENKGPARTMHNSITRTDFLITLLGLDA